MELNLENYNKIFFVGIGGISMSALAFILKANGKIVLGSDLNKSSLTKKLEKAQIKVFYSHKEKNIEGCDLVVFSGAVSNDNPEIKKAREQNITIIERSELLYLISKDYKNVIAISGTHGKTTTTSMIAHVFMLAGLNPTIHIGGECDYIKGNYAIGNSDYFITEACEFRDSFLTLKPTISIINNIEPEHLDYFKTYENEIASFKKFQEQTTCKCFVNSNCASLLVNHEANKIKNNNTKICCEEEIKTDCKTSKVLDEKENLQKNSENAISQNIETYGYDNSDKISAKNIELTSDGKYSFDCFKGKNFVGNFKLNIYGKHNIDNALATISVCLHFKIDYKTIYLGLRTFNNAHRRFEFIGKCNNNFVIHDYAHHPTEIERNIQTAKEVFKKDIVCVFQPHTYSRTSLLIDNFQKCFEGVSFLYLLKTYSARENFDDNGSSEHLKQRILETNPTYKILGAFTKKQFLKEYKKQKHANCIILFLGAGDIEKLPKKIIKRKNLF